jgi:cell cycle serine/threonine-protein kinase CDC5/MSD2
MSISIADQEREFQKAVQPGSPISALLSSARQPLLVGPAQTREVPLIRKLQQVSSTANQGSSRERALPPLPTARTALANIEEEAEDPKRREIESQKARIVAQMVPQGSAPSSATPLSAAFPSSLAAMKEAVDENIPPSIGSALSAKSRMPSTMSLTKMSSTATLRSNLANMKGYDAFIHTLELAFNAKHEGKLFRDPSKSYSIPA